jgi:hypothetical protein
VSAFWNVGDEKAPNPLAPDAPVGRWNDPLAPETPNGRPVGKVTPWLFRHAMNAASFAVPDLPEAPDVPVLPEAFLEVFAIDVFVDFVLDDAAATPQATKRRPMTPTASTAINGRMRLIDGGWIITTRRSHIVLRASR